MPIYNQAIAALDTLTKTDLIEMRTLANPPSGCVITMEVICIMLKVNPIKVKTEDGMGKRDDY